MRRNLAILPWGLAAGALVLAPLSVLAQTAISAKAGMVHVADGDVYLADKKLELKPSEFPDIKSDQVLRTVEGRAEVLLAPGSFLRMDEDSSFRMVSNKLTDVRIELLTGAFLVEVAELNDEDQIRIVVGGVSTSLEKAGLYRFDADPARLRVFEGEVQVRKGEQLMTVKSGREVMLGNEVLAQAKFDKEETDRLFRWSRARSQYVSMANLSAARQAESGGYGYASRGGWIFNSYLGMMTWLPYDGIFRSPFGWSFYSPNTIWNVYRPNIYSYRSAPYSGGSWSPAASYRGSFPGGGESSGLPSRSVSGGYSGPSVSAGAPSAPSAPAASAPSSPRGGSDAGGRGGAGGGGRQ